MGSMTKLSALMGILLLALTIGQSPAAAPTGASRSAST
jgi:hypothetical protein